MADMVTKKMLEGAVKSLNACHTEPKYEIEYMYGKCRLMRKNEHDRPVNISGLGTKRETFYIVDAIRTVALIEALEKTV